MTRMRLQMNMTPNYTLRILNSLPYRVLIKQQRSSTKNTLIMTLSATMQATSTAYQSLTLSGWSLEIAIMVMIGSQSIILTHKYTLMVRRIVKEKVGNLRTSFFSRFFRLNNGSIYKVQPMIMITVGTSMAGNELMTAKVEERSCMS